MPDILTVETINLNPAPTKEKKEIGVQGKCPSGWIQFSTNVKTLV